MKLTSWEIENAVESAIFLARTNRVKDMTNSTIIMSKIRQILKMYSQRRSKLWMADQIGVSRDTFKMNKSRIDNLDPV